MRFRVFAPGGLFSPDDLERLVEVLSALSVKELGVGERQDLVGVCAESKNDSLAMVLNRTGFAWARAEIEAHNVVSSAVALGLTSATPWLVSDSFREALDCFAVSPRLRVGVTDPRQGLVPCYGHDLNFTADERPNSWRLDLRLAGDDELFPWPVLFDTRELARAAWLLEDEIVAYENRDPDALVVALAKRFPANRPLDRQRPARLYPRLPVHEGMNRLTSQSLSLGLWTRSETFSLELLSEVARLCKTTGLGLIGLTPWKSLILSGIRDQERHSWEDLLNRHGLNTRHAAQELGWIVGSKKEQKRKESLTRQLIRHDVRTYGLTFSLSAQRRSTSVVVERSGPDFWPFWNILRSSQLGAEGSNYFVKKKFVPSWRLGPELAKTCRSFFFPSTCPTAVKQGEQENPGHPVCPDCLTTYDPAWGDPLGGVDPGTAFQVLPNDWVCPVCGTPGRSFA